MNIEMATLTAWCSYGNHDNHRADAGTLKPKTLNYCCVFYWDNGKENGNYYNGLIGIMEKKMESTIMGYIGFRA